MLLRRCDAGRGPRTPSDRSSQPKPRSTAVPSNLKSDELAIFTSETGAPSKMFTQLEVTLQLLESHLYSTDQSRHFRKKMSRGRLLRRRGGQQFRMRKDQSEQSRRPFWTRSYLSVRCFDHHEYPEPRLGKQDGLKSRTSAEWFQLLLAGQTAAVETLPVAWETRRLLSHTGGSGDSRVDGRGRRGGVRNGSSGAG